MPDRPKGWEWGPPPEQPTREAASELNDRLGARFEPLLNYLEVKGKGGWGWGSNYDQSVLGSWNGGEVDYAYLKGHYSMLLELALELVPPAYLHELRKHGA